MARGGLQHVPGYESGQFAARRALREHVESQFRGPTGQRRPYPPGQPADGGGGRGRWPLRRYPGVVLMEPFTVHNGLVAPLDRVDVDTDQIIPKQFLKSIARTGFEAGLFYDWRSLPDGSPNPDFVLN